MSSQQRSEKKYIKPSLDKSFKSGSLSVLIWGLNLTGLCCESDDLYEMPI